MNKKRIGYQRKHSHFVKASDLLIRNETNIEKNSSMIISAKCKIALKEIEPAQMIIEKLCAHYSDEGIKLGIELANKQMNKGGE